MTRSVYVVDAVDTDGAGSGDGPEMDIDADGDADGGTSYIRDGMNYETLLDAAFSRAASSGNTTWIVAVDRCAEENHVRVSLAQGTLSEPPLPEMPRVQIIDEGIPSVGEYVDSRRIEAFTGLGPVPVSALFDSRADTSGTAWAMGMAVAFRVDEDADAGLTGLVVFGVDYGGFVDATSSAIARALTDVIALDEGCPLECSEFVPTYFQVGYDRDDDGIVTVDEVEASGPTLGAQVTHDLQAIHDDAEVFWPHHDGNTDSMTFGIRFHARAALED